MVKTAVHVDRRRLLAGEMGLGMGMAFESIVGTHTGQGRTGSSRTRSRYGIGNPLSCHAPTGLDQFQTSIRSDLPTSPDF